MSPFTSSLGLRTLGIHFLLENLLTLLLGLGFVDLQDNVSFIDNKTSCLRTCSTSARLCLKVLPLLRW